MAAPLVEVGLSGGARPTLRPSRNKGPLIRATNTGPCMSARKQGSASTMFFARDVDAGRCLSLR